MWIDLPYLIRRKKGDYGKELEDAQLPVGWQEAINNIHPELASYTEYKEAKKDTLYIKVSDSFLISELEARKEGIRRELNKNRKNPVSNIKFTLS